MLGVFGGYVVNLYLCVRGVYGVCFFSMTVVCMVCGVIVFRGYVNVCV